MDSITKARRAKFEAAYQAKYQGMPLGWSDGAGAYLYGHANGAWFGYNAALDSLVIELPHICMTRPKQSKRRGVKVK
jgi:hypothetical protein